MTPEVLQAEFTKFERSYTQTTADTGPIKYQRLNDFRNGAFAALQQDVQQRLNQAKQQELAAERQRAQQAELQAQQANPFMPASESCTCMHSASFSLRCDLLLARDP